MNPLPPVTTTFVMTYSPLVNRSLTLRPRRRDGPLPLPCRKISANRDAAHNNPRPLGEGRPRTLQRPAVCATALHTPLPPTTLRTARAAGSSTLFDPAVR